MNRAEKESHIIAASSGRGSSFQQIMETAQHTLDWQLRVMKDESQRVKIEKEYDDELDRILMWIGSEPRS
jgi:hypothetical protein